MVVFRELMDDSLSTPDDVQRRLRLVGAEFVASVPRLATPDDVEVGPDPAAVLEMMDGEAALLIDKIRQRVNPADGPVVVGVTGHRPGRGCPPPWRSHLSRTLALCHGLRVALVDANEQAEATEPIPPGRRRPWLGLPGRCPHLLAA